ALEITKLVNEGEKIMIDGATGKITLLDRPGFRISRRYEDSLNFEVSYKDLEPFWYDKGLVLLMDFGDKIIMFHTSNDANVSARLTDAIYQNRHKPVVDGEADVWFAYANALELSKVDADLLAFLSRAEGIAKVGGRKEITAFIYECVKEGEELYENAMKNMDKYNNAHKKEDFIRGFTDMYLAEAYTHIGARLMLYD